MRWGIGAFLSGFVSALVILNLLLQLISLATNRWANFTARIDLHKPKETGHFGLWTLCSTKAPKWEEDCDRMDTFFEGPPYMQIAGIIAVVHSLQLVALIPMSVVRTLQIARESKDFLIKTKIICIAKVVVAFISVILSILVTIMASIGENKSEYTVTKGWSFWIQTAVIVLDVAITTICAIENVRFWQDHIRENADPWGHRSETYGNPSFESGSPSLPRRPQENGNVAFTAASGDPYIEVNKFRTPLFDGAAATTANNGGAKPRTKVTLETNSGLLTFENPSFQESSPTSRRKI